MHGQNVGQIKEASVAVALVKGVQYNVWYKMVRWLVFVLQFIQGGCFDDYTCNGKK